MFIFGMISFSPVFIASINFDEFIDAINLFPFSASNTIELRRGCSFSQYIKSGEVDSIDLSDNLIRLSQKLRFTVAWSISISADKLSIIRIAVPLNQLRNLFELGVLTQVEYSEYYGVKNSLMVYRGEVRLNNPLPIEILNSILCKSGGEGDELYVFGYISSKGPIDFPHFYLYSKKNGEYSFGFQSDKVNIESFIEKFEYISMQNLIESAYVVIEYIGEDSLYVFEYYTDEDKRMIRSFYVWNFYKYEKNITL